MRGSQITTSKTTKRYPLVQSSALQIFLILLVPLLIATIHVYRLGVEVVTAYEANQLKTMMKRSVETSTELIHIDGEKNAEEGHYLDLAVAMQKIDELDFFSVADQEDGSENSNKSTVDLKQAGLQFWYVVDRGDGRILLVDKTASTRRELTEEENLFVRCREAVEDTSAIQWEDGGTYFCLFMQSIDSPLTFNGSPLLYNIANAHIGMLVEGDLSFVEDSVRERVFVYVVVLFGALLVIIAAMCVSVHRYLRVLRDMSGIMQSYRIQRNPIVDEFRKRLSVFRKQSRDSELKDLTESFYVMAVNLIDYQETVGSIKNQYEPFVPEALLGMFHEEDPLYVRPGDTAEFAGTFLKVRFECCDVEDTSLLCGKVCEIVSSKGGIVVHIAEAEMEAIFPASKSGEADTCEAERAGRESAELIRNLEKNKAEIGTIRTELRHGLFCLQVIGCEKRRAVRLIEKGIRNA